MPLSLSWPRALTPARAAAFTSALLVLAIAWTLAQATWLLWPGKGEVGVVGGEAPRTAPAQPPARLQSVADLSLFGAPPAAGNGLEAPQTQLNLILRGVWAGPVRQWARAIIAGNGDEKSYRIGETLPGGAILDQVLPDRVILKRGGRSEALYLPRDSMAGVVTDPSLASPAGLAAAAEESAAPVGDVSARMKEYRQRIMDNPQEVFSLARMQPVMEDGKLKGYKLSPNKEKQLFREVGLRPGDLVVGVNGLSLSDPAALSQVMTQVSTATQLTLVVDRGGRQETLIVPIGK
jgi:general secretion pathway protein C